MSGGGAEREGERESQAGSMLIAWSQDVRLELTHHEIKSQMVSRLSHPSTPGYYHFVRGS